MTEDLLAKHRTLLEEGRTYEFFQVIQSLARRKLQKKDFDSALTLATEGTKELLSRGDLESAVGLLDLLVEILKSKADLNTIQQLYVVLPPPHKFEFLTKVLGFCKEPVLHVMLATGYQDSGDNGRAALHWVQSGQVSGLVTCLRQLMVLGLAGEQDLFVARAGLQLIALGKLEQAAELLRHFSPLESPILNFVKFLLKAAELKEPRLVSVLKEKYAPSLARDPSFDKYLQQVEVTVFGQAPPSEDFSSIFQFFSRS